MYVHFCFVWFFSIKGKFCYDQGRYLCVFKMSFWEDHRQWKEANLSSNLDLLAISVSSFVRWEYYYLHYKVTVCIE